MPSRSERQVQDINRSLMQQQLNRSEIQQNQFEVNQLRNEIQRNSTAPIAPGLRPGCPPGSIGC